MKKCSGCGETKPKSEFYKRKGAKDGLCGQCKECCRKKRRQHYKDNKEEMLKKKRQYREDNKEEIATYQKQYRKDNKEALLKQRRQYREGNKEEIAEYQKQYRQDNEEALKKQRKQYYENNKEEIAVKRKQYTKDKRLNNPSCKLWTNLRNGLRRVIKTGNKTEIMKKYLGCSAEELKRHIEKQFKKGMTWENYGYYGWHIDHIIPISTIKDKNDIEQLKKVCHYTNLQPLWAEENMSKSDKIIESKKKYDQK